MVRAAVYRDESKAATVRSIPQEEWVALDSITETVEALLRFGEQFLVAGSTAYRTRQAVGELAEKMGVDSLSMEIGLRNIAATATCRDKTVTIIREIVEPRVNSTNLRELQSLVATTPNGLLAKELNSGLARIEGATRNYSIAATCLAVGLACGSFAFLNGGWLTEIFTASIAGGFGQCLRTLLAHRHLNSYAIYLLSGLSASSVYVALATILVYSGLDSESRHAAGFISSVLFLVPGFPMVSAVLDLLRHQTTVAISRLAHVVMLLLMAALGLSIVIDLAGISINAPAPPSMDLELLIGARMLASFVGAFGFAILFNGSCRNAFYVGMLAIFGNEIRLALRDVGLSLPVSTFLGALVIGFSASFLRRRVNEPRISLTVAASVMMVPGVYTFETLVHFNSGNILDGLKTGFLAGFVVGAMALGLALSRFISEPSASERPRR